MNDSAIQAAKAQIEAARATAGKPVIRTFFDEPTFTATHVVHDPVTRRAAIIDSVQDFDQAAGRTSHVSADAVIAYVREQNLTVEWLLETTDQHRWCYSPLLFRIAFAGAMLRGIRDREHQQRPNADMMAPEAGGRGWFE